MAVLPADQLMQANSLAGGAGQMRTMPAMIGPGSGQNIQRMQGQMPVGQNIQTMQRQMQPNQISTTAGGFQNPAGQNPMMGGAGAMQRRRPRGILPVGYQPTNRLGENILALQQMRMNPQMANPMGSFAGMPMGGFRPQMQAQPQPMNAVMNPNMVQRRGY